MTIQPRCSHDRNVYEINIVSCFLRKFELKNCHLYMHMQCNLYERFIRVLTLKIAKKFAVDQKNCDGPQR